MNTTDLIGKSIPRIDGPLKVTGEAKYSSDFQFPGMLFAVSVPATIANGEVSSIDTKLAKSLPGVREIFTSENMDKLYRSDGNHEARAPLEDQQISYWGQYVALAVADSIEAATAAAHAVQVTYKPSSVDVRNLNKAEIPNTGNGRGDPSTAFENSAVKLDEIYRTPTETHNPMELHATVAVYDAGTGYTVYETTQGVGGARGALSRQLGESGDRVRVITRFLGSGFGGKINTWPHAALTCMAAKVLGKPVQTVVTRKQEFECVGHRSATIQRVRIGASSDGKLQALLHDYASASAMDSGNGENCGEATWSFYGVPNLQVSGSVVHRNIGSPTAMRGPGAVPGVYATESAMDEMAIKLGLDPIQFRILNEPAVDPSNNQPFSSRHYLECLAIGAEKIGWHKRNPKPGTLHDGEELIGYGVGGGSWFAGRGGANVNVELHDDGTANVLCGTQDIGTGTYTIFAQIVSEKLGIPIHKIRVTIGDSNLPGGPMSGGSMVTATIIPATLDGVKQAITMLLSKATAMQGSPFSSEFNDSLKYENGMVTGGKKSIPFAEILKGMKMKSIVGEGHSGGNFGGGYSMHSYVAHFAVVGWTPSIARLRVKRVVSAIDGGRIINVKTGRNQILGAVIMGVGMALFEGTHYEKNYGAPINSNYADYLVPTHADAPKIDVHFLDHPDIHVNELGARGIGEIGLAGVAPAIGNAVYNATGKRVRSLPIRIEDLILP